MGGGVIKQRVARPGQGKSGGFRTIILYRTAKRAFFVYGFVKSDCDNIDDDEEAEFKKAAEHVLGLSEAHLSQPIFVSYLNVSKNLLSNWERGVKKPGGPALRLLTVVEKNGIQAIA